jgi:hypothetical protein
MSKCRSRRPFNLGINGNAITVSAALQAAIMHEIDGDRVDPMAAPGVDPDDRRSGPSALIKN